VTLSGVGAGNGLWPISVWSEWWILTKTYGQRLLAPTQGVRLESYVYRILPRSIGGGHAS